jgi:hypothetical protein
MLEITEREKERANELMGQLLQADARVRTAFARISMTLLEAMVNERGLLIMVDVEDAVSMHVFGLEPEKIYTMCAGTAEAMMDELPKSSGHVMAAPETLQ